MKSTCVIALLALCTSAVAIADSYEIVMTKFKDEISYEEQAEAMSRLNEVVNNFEGFKSRDYFYSHEANRWVDFVSWTELALAKKASKIAPTIEIAAEIFSLMDESSAIFSHYTRVGGTIENQSALACTAEQ